MVVPNNEELSNMTQGYLVDYGVLGKGGVFGRKPVFCPFWRWLWETAEVLESDILGFKF